MPTDDQLRWLETIGDADELARSLIESGLINDPDERVQALVRRSWAGRGESSKLIACLYPTPSPAKGQKRHRKRVEQLMRNRGLWAEAIPAPSEPEDVPTSAEGDMPNGDPEITTVRPPASYPVDQALAIHLHENGAKLWPHIEGLSFQPPPGYEGRRVVINPFAAPPAKRRSSTLSALHACRLYNAVSFAMAKHGAIMNAHFTILWELMGIHDHRRAAKIMGRYLNEAQKWMRSPTRQQNLHWVYVHEAGPERGFHSHILMRIPRYLQREFEQWSRGALARIARRDEIPGRAFRLSGGRRDNDADAVRRCWAWFRYLTKQLGDEETLRVRNPDGGREVLVVREVFKPWPFRSAGPIECAQLIGGSHGIWTKAQAQAGFRSWLEQGKFERMYAGEEIEFFRREQERASAPEPWAPNLSLRS